MGPFLHRPDDARARDTAATVLRRRRAERVTASDCGDDTASVCGDDNKHFEEDHGGHENHTRHAHDIDDQNDDSDDDNNISHDHVEACANNTNNK